VPLSFEDVFPDVLEEWRAKSKSRLHQDDIEAWAWDVLGERYWSKQRLIIDSFQHNRRTAVKSANGTGKSRLVGGLICHWVVTAEAPGDNLALVTGPALKTVRDVVWDYLNKYYGIAQGRGAEWPGTIYSSLQDLSWRVNTTGKKEPVNMVIGLKPGDGSDIVGAFQGRRGRRKTAVFMDEAGSLHPDIYVGAEAVTTGPESRICAIGNPDNGRGSHFYKIFNEPEAAKHWKHFTIRADELPTFTGEIVYEDPEKQAEMLNSGMPTPDWVDDKRTMWGVGSARWKAKVEGEFPEEDDNTLFSQTAIDCANGLDIDHTRIEDEDEIRIFGVDLAFGGLDETQVYFNHNCEVRRFDSWGKATPLENARKVHRLAQENGIQEVRIDAGGAGEGVYDMLCNLEEFQDRTYSVVGILGGNPSPDPTQWAQARSWHYDMFRRKMLNGEVSLDIKDKKLQDNLISQTYEINNRGAIQVTTKKEMRRNGLPSPDSLDAAIYATVDPDFEAPVAKKTETYDTEMVLAEYQDEDFLADYRAYRW
jgi:hypothetical protein